MQMLDRQKQRTWTGTVTLNMKEQFIIDMMDVFSSLIMPDVSKQTSSTNRNALMSTES